LLRGSGRGGLERHQTLQAAVEWSYKLLSPVSRDLFDQLSVFAGSFDLGAVEAICVVDELDVEPLDVVADLVDKSMVVAEEAGRRTRYRLLETLRQYGERRLDERDETRQLRDRHSDYFTNEATLVSSLAYTGGETTYFAFIDVNAARRLSHSVSTRSTRPSNSSSRLRRGPSSRCAMNTLNGRTRSSNSENV
jgi:predicted ATPase